MKTHQSFEHRPTSTAAQQAARDGALTTDPKTSFVESESSSA